ncbi:MAG: hypothetical protein OXH83_02475 [Bryobacterales bacterium]|nr:hypothetical protein [Bryobacterales bacterium]
MSSQGKLEPPITPKDWAIAAACAVVYTVLWAKEGEFVGFALRGIGIALIYVGWRFNGLAIAAACWLLTPWVLGAMISVAIKMKWVGLAEFLVDGLEWIGRVLYGI